MNKPVILTLGGLTKRFGSVIAYDAVDLTLHRGEVRAQPGKNGAGKTTLMKMLFRQYTPDAGYVEIVEQDGTARAKIERLMQQSGLITPLDEKIRSLSVGERQCVEILKALFHDTRVLVLDEPTVVLTPQEADGLFAALRKMFDKGLSAIFISHKLHEVLAFSDRIAVLRHGRKVAGLTTADADKALIATLMVGEETVPPTRQDGVPGDAVLELRGVTVRHESARNSLHDVSLVVRPGEIFGLAGVSGNGQAALAQLILGLLHPDAGSVLVAGQVISRPSPKSMMQARVGRIPEDRHHDGVVGTMSGGNIQKLILARVLEQEPLVILANQPTRGLDFGAAGDVARRLIAARRRGAGVLLISEDLDEDLSLADRIVVMHDGRLIEAQTRDRGRIGLLIAGQAA